VKLCRDDWAFCILTRCGTKLNQLSPGDTAGLETIKREAELALAMGISKPKVQEFGQSILSKVQEFRGVASAVGGTVVESKNFRVHHQQAGELASQVLQLAEKARADAIQKWFGNDNTPWAVRCELYLHANSEQYVRATKGLPQAHGHTTLEVKDGKPTGRRIDLVADNPNLLPAALPREVTHVVLADIFSAPLLPRWADEAMAVLAEPRANVERYDARPAALPAAGAAICRGAAAAIEPTSPTRPASRRSTPRACR
jgi:hypothetical protein